MKPRVGVSRGAALTPTCDASGWLHRLRAVALQLDHTSWGQRQEPREENNLAPEKTINKKQETGPPLPGARTHAAWAEPCPPPSSVGTAAQRPRVVWGPAARRPFHLGCAVTGAAELPR